MWRQLVVQLWSHLNVNTCIRVPTLTSWLSWHKKKLLTCMTGSNMLNSRPT